MNDKPEPAITAHQYDVQRSAGPFREPGKDVLSYDFFVNRKGWVTPRVMRVFVAIKGELEHFQHRILDVSGGSPGQQLKITQMLTQKIAEQKLAIVLEEGRIERGTEVLVQEFSGNDGYLFTRLEAWMKEVREKVREEIKTRVGV